MWDLCSNQGSNLHHLHWNCKVLTTGPSREVPKHFNFHFGQQNPQTQYDYIEIHHSFLSYRHLLSCSPHLCLAMAPTPLTHLLASSNPTWADFFCCLVTWFSPPFSNPVFHTFFLFLNSQPEILSIFYIQTF